MTYDYRDGVYQHDRSAHEVVLIMRLTRVNRNWELGGSYDLYARFGRNWLNELIILYNVKTPAIDLKKCSP